MNIKKVSLTVIHSIIYIAGIIALLTFIPQWFPITQNIVSIIAISLCVGFVVFLIIGFLSRIFHFNI